MSHEYQCFFYCKNLDRVMGVYKEAVPSDWGWLCDCLCWYDPWNDVERVKHFIGDEVNYDFYDKWFIIPKCYNKHFVCDCKGNKIFLDANIGASCYKKN